jgi:DnaK suppressor protein
VAPATAKKAPAKKAAATATAPAKKPAQKPGAKKGSTAVRTTTVANGAGAAAATTTFTPKPKPPAPVRPKTGPYAKDAKFLEEVRDLLQAERAVYQEQATSLRAEADSLALEREPGDVQFDEESGEGGTVTVDRERNLALSGQATLAVEEIDDALARIADKTYGYCERCFQPIPKPRLRALPYARLCVACKSGGLSRR